MRIFRPKVNSFFLNQDNDEKSSEVPKMRDYYSNAAYTLVSIQTEIEKHNIGDPHEMLKKVTQSPWFDRSWTFQEGWLSKNTLFMFDNLLADGGLLAIHWALGQPSYTDNARYKNTLDEGEQKIATPLGWIYYKKGYNDNDKAYLTLNQALAVIKNRDRYMPADGIYSILGFLVYGNKMQVDYNEELKKILFRIMKFALENGHGDIISWSGSGNDWLPKYTHMMTLKKKK